MRLLITSHPGLGHVYPAVAVGAAARRRGHQVAVATGPRYRDWVTDAGLRYFEAGADWDISIPTGVHPWLMMVKGSPPRFAADLVEIAGTWQPDVILREEMEMAGWVVGAALGIPCATLGLGVNEPVEEFLQEEIADGFAALRAELGAPADPEMKTLHRYLYLDQYPAGWVPPERRPAGVYHTIGVATLDEEPAPLAEAGGETRLYVTLGTVFGEKPALIQTILDALGVLGVAATVTLGRQGDPDAFTAPAGVELARFIPQDEVLPRCSAVICHAGTGTTLGTLRYGLPLVLIPMGANQGWTARLAEQNGVARRVLGEEPVVRHLPGLWADLDTITVDEIVAAVQAVLGDDAYRQRARRTGRELRERWQSGVAVSLLEQLAATGEPVTDDRF